MINGIGIRRFRLFMSRLQSGSFLLIPTGGEKQPESENSERKTK